MIEPYPRYLPLGDQVLVVQYGNEVSEQASLLIQVHAGRIREAKLKGIVQVIPTLSSLAVCYDPRHFTHAGLIAKVRELAEADAPLAPNPPTQTGRNKTLHIPIAYGGRFGPDLAGVAERTGLSEREVVRLHSERIYTVYMLGMTAGFPYCGQLDERLALKRQETPRTQSGKGAVGIANRQTLIYPVLSPSGWHIIGRTPMNIFVPDQHPPSLVLAGDRIKFEPIGAEEAEAWDRIRQEEWNAIWHS